MNSNSCCSCKLNPLANVTIGDMEKSSPYQVYLTKKSA